jgi:GNAT superfamily N-acetyltransferase
MITFERATPEDAEVIVQLKIRAFAEDVERYGSGPPNYDSIDHTRYYIQTTGTYYKIMKDGIPIGGFGLFLITPEHMRVGSLYIDPAYHNQSIGSQAIQFMESAFPHIRKWSLDTPYKNYRNHHFYEKNGYVKVGETPPEGPNGFYLFLYEKNIPCPS